MRGAIPTWLGPFMDLALALSMARPTRRRPVKARQKHLSKSRGHDPRGTLNSAHVFTAVSPSDAPAITIPGDAFASGQYEKALRRRRFQSSGHGLKTASRNQWRGRQHCRAERDADKTRHRNLLLTKSVLLTKCVRRANSAGRAYPKAINRPAQAWFRV